MLECCVQHSSTTCRYETCIAARNSTVHGISWIVASITTITSWPKIPSHCRKESEALNPTKKPQIAPPFTLPLLMLWKHELDEFDEESKDSTMTVKGV